jgi:hypothetical protein
MSLPGSPSSTASFRALQLATQFGGLVEHGKRIAAAPSKSELYKVLVQALKELFGTPDCGVFTPSGKRLAGSPDLNPTQRVREEALRRLEVVLSSDLPESSDSLILEGLTSRLCAPVLSQEKPLFLLWVCHQGVGGVLGERELDLATYLTVLVSTTWENLEHIEHARAQRTEIQALAARKQALFDLSPTANAELSADGELLRVNASWKNLGLDLQRWETWSEEEVLHHGIRYRRTQAPLSHGGRLLSVTPVVTEEAKKLAERQRLRLQQLKASVESGAIQPIHRFVSSLDRCEEADEVKESVAAAQLAITSVLELIGELRGRVSTLAQKEQ